MDSMAVLIRIFLLIPFCIAAVYFNDLKMATAILNEKDPREQKSLARKVINFDETEWNKVSQSVVKQGSLAKVILHYFVK